MTVQYSVQKMVSDGTLSTIALGIQYLQRNDVYVRIDGVETPQSGAPSGYTWSFLDSNTIRVLPVVPAGVEVVVYRRTDLDIMYNVYSQNAQFDESTIDENNQQLLYIAQEYFEQGVPAQLIESIEYVREDTTNTYYRLKLSDGKYTTEFQVPKGGAAGYEALRRSYAEAGYTLVSGSFEEGGELTSVTDVLLHKTTGVAYSGPIGQIPPDTDPTAPGSDYVPRSSVLLRGELLGTDGANLIGAATYAQIRAYTGSATRINCLGRNNIFDGAHGDFILDHTDTTSTDNDGTVLVDANGGRWKRQISGDVNVRWWLDGTGPSHDCGPGFQKAINAYPRSRIQVPLDESGYYFDTQVVEPNSSSYELVGTEGIQSSLQQVMYARTSGAVFYSPAGQTTFTRYRGFRFTSNKSAYPAARAIHIAGDWVHGEMKSIVAQNFNLNPLLVSGASNVCNYQHVMGMFNNSWALRVEQGSGNTFSRITGDNNDGPVMYSYGGSNTYTNLYSEDCCKRNVTHGETNPEFLFGGDTPVVNGIILNSYAGNVTPPVLLAACRNMTLIGGANKSTTPPSYAYDINIAATDSSLTMINSSGMRTGNSDENVVLIDAGYTATRPSIKVGPSQRNIYLLCPVAQVCFNGTGTPVIHQAAGIAAVARAGIGEYDIAFAEPIPYPNGIIVTGMADNDGGALNVTVSEVLGARTATKVRIRTQRTDGLNIDVQFISVVIHGITG